MALNRSCQQTSCFLHVPSNQTFNPFITTMQKDTNGTWHISPSREELHAATKMRYEAHPVYSASNSGEILVMPSKPKPKSSKPRKGKTVATLRHDAKRKNLPTAEFQSLMREADKSPDSRRLRAPQPRPRPAARLARQGRAGLERPRRPCPAALHPGEGPSQGPHRRPAPRSPRPAPKPTAPQIDLFADFNGLPKDARQDRVLPARRRTGPTA